MIQILVWNLIKTMIWRKAMILIGVTLLAMTGVGLVVLLLFFLGKQMMTSGCCSYRGSGDEQQGGDRA